MASQAAGAPQGAAKETETEGALGGPGLGGMWGVGGPALAPRTPGCLRCVRVTCERDSMKISSVLGTISKPD